MADSKKNIELRSEEVQDILSYVPNWMIRWGNLLILVLIIMILFISWFIKYPDVINSSAMITTQIPPQKEYAKVTGKINKILIIDNQTVKKNQPLAILENTANYKDVFFLKTIVDTIKLDHKNFVFPLEKLPILFLGDVESDYAIFENNYVQYQLNKELDPFANSENANQLSLSELKGRLQSLILQKELQKSELDFKRKDLERYESLFNKGIISAQEYESKQLEFLQTERNYKNAGVSISQIRESINNNHKTSKETKINRTKEEINLLKSVIQSFNQLKKSIKDWEFRYVLSSNINGEVSFLEYWNENQQVSSGDLVFTIIPSQNSSFIAKITAPVQNSGKIKNGQKVNFKLENYPDNEFGMLTGHIKSISVIPNEEGQYLINVSLPEKLVTTYNKEILFKQEMRANAEIITEDLRLIERFFHQFKTILN